MTSDIAALQNKVSKFTISPHRNLKEFPLLSRCYISMSIPFIIFPETKIDILVINTYSNYICICLFFFTIQRKQGRVKLLKYSYTE